MKVLSVFGQVGIGLLVGTFFSLAALVDVSYGAEVAYKFTTVDIPLRFTFLGQERNDIVRLTDINNNGEMVGNDFAGDGFFVNTNHMATEIRCPGDQTDNDSTTVSAINNAGDVVGSCYAGAARAFVRNRNGIITLLNFPGADGTIGLGINDLGHVVGQYWGFAFGTGLDRFHGFVWKDGVYTAIDAPFPDAMTTGLLAINNAGQIIGTYLHHRPGSTQINDYDSEVAFLYENGTFTLLDFPGAKLPYLCCGPTTFPMNINNRGQVIGSTYNSDGKPQFFLYHKGTYLVVTGIPQGVLDADDFSVIHDNTALGINDQGVLAGTYVQRVLCETCGPHGEPDDRFEVHSFIATPTRTPPTLTIPTPPVTLLQVVRGDLNGDGVEDLAGRDALYTVWQCLAGEAACTHIGHWLFTMVVGDLDGDGRDDLAGLGWGYTIWVMTDGLHFTQLPGTLHTLVVGDFYGDGKDHLAGLWQQTIWRSPRLGWWDWLPGTLTTLVAGDFDGDGIDDLAGIAPGYYSWVHTAHGWHWSPGFVYTMQATRSDTGADTLLGAWGICTYTMDTALTWQTQSCNFLLAEGE